MRKPELASSTYLLGSEIGEPGVGINTRDTKLYELLGRRSVYRLSVAISAIDDEDAIVKQLGMDYIHVPVNFDRPTSSDFYAFAGILQTGPALNTLLHCQVNFRASSFSFLYRVICDGVDVADAKEDMNLVWQPNETWRKFIFEVPEENDISHECDVCDWTPKGH